MTPSPQVTTVFVGALAILIGACLTFGHRYSDRSERLAGNSSELNEIKASMRSETTVPVIDKIWRYLLQTDGAMRDAGLLKGPLDLRSGNVLDAKSLSFDVNRRGYFNVLINELEKTFKESSSIDKSWLGLSSCYTQIGQALYVLAAVIGLGGYGLMLLTLYQLMSLSLDEMNLLTAGVGVSALITIIVIIVRYRKARSLLIVYGDGKKKYLVEVTRV